MAGRVNLGTTDFAAIDFPNLIQAQLDSFKEFTAGGIQKLFDEINPVKDSMERMWTLEFKDFEYRDVNRSLDESVSKGLTYDMPLYAKAQLLNNKTGEIKQQEIFIADVPVMTDNGYFVINGVRRVITHQIVRAPGVLYDKGITVPGRQVYNAKLMPTRGPWYEFEISKTHVISVRLVQKRPKILLTELLRVFGFETDDEIRDLFKDVDNHKERRYIESTLARDLTRNRMEAVMHIYNKIRPDETVTLESAEKYVKGHFFSDRRFDLGKVGRYQLNRKLGTTNPLEGPEANLTVDDIVLIIKKLIEVNNGTASADDVDNLSNRRVRSVGEVLIDQLRQGVRRVEKNVKDKMSMYGEDAKLTPSMLISTKPVSASIMSFFGSNALSHFMDQENILSELENKRRVTAAGPGGLTKERATFSIREVHHSHYGRFCSVTSPESQSIGVVTHLALFARINDFGFIEVPYKKVLSTLTYSSKQLQGRILRENLEVDGKKIGKAGEVIDDKMVKVIKDAKAKDIRVRSFVSNEIEYLDAATEATKVITMSQVEQDEDGNIVEDLVPVRHIGDFVMEDVNQVEYIDLIPTQQSGVGAACVPFIGHDDSKRALTGSNQQRQGVPLVKQEAPIVGTGMEESVARASGWGVFAEDDGVVEYVDAKRIDVKYKKLGTKTYEIVKFFRSNQDTNFSQRPVVDMGQKFKKGQVLVDGPSMENGELAVGINLRAALMFYEGYNYEDSVIISERIVKEDLLTSIHIKEYTADLRDTELGPEILTADIPHVSEDVLKKLDVAGMVRVGQKVVSGDILTGIVAPRGKQDLTAEEKLLRAIFGESASDIRDNSNRVPHGDKGIVIKTQLLSTEEGDKLPPGVLKQVKVWVANTKKINYGDKISGRHGDKNTIASIRPVEDMPFTADGKPVDIILTPAFIKRMNMGQAMEVHYGLWASLLDEKFAIPSFDEIDTSWIEDQMKEKGLEMLQKVDLWDGRTGEKFPRPVTVGMKYVLKLKHIAGEKVHSRSTGPYTLVTQQPLGGKAQFGGQRFGEMEVWALEAHGVPSTLQEMLTIKSDDVKGRADAYKAIIHGEKIEGVNVPESFKVLVKELNALGLKIDLISNELVEEEEVYEEHEEL